MNHGLYHNSIHSVAACCHDTMPPVSVTPMQPHYMASVESVEVELNTMAS